jgi:hypothetical protein
MIKKKAYKIFALLLSMVVLFSTMGMTINAHYCHTTDTMQKSLLPFPIDCEHKELSIDYNPVSADENIQACCSIPEPRSASEKVVLEEGCCEDFFQFIKGITDFQLPQFEFKIIFNKFLALTVRLFELLSPTKANPKQTALFELQNQPPPLSGKDLTITIHQLKLDTHLL